MLFTRCPSSGFVLKDLLIVLLAVVAVVQGYLLFKPSRSSISSPDATGGPAPEHGLTGAAKVQKVAIEPGDRRNLIIVFDRPVVEPGAMPDKRPAQIKPDISGQWSWLSTNVLQFTAYDRFVRGKTYTVDLDTSEQGLSARLASPTSHTVAVEAFLLRNASLRLEPEPNQPAKVRVHGQLSFNDTVQPETLLAALTLRDPSRKEPLKLTVEDTYPNSQLDFVSEPIAKTREARTLTLTVDKALTPNKVPTPLGKDVTRTIPLVLDPELRLKNVKADPPQAENSASGTSSGSITLSFSTPVTADALRAGLQVTPKNGPADGPPLRIGITVNGQEATITGPFAPQGSYLVKLPTGFAAADGATLGKPETREAVIPDIRPQAWFRDRGLFMAAKGRRAMTVQAVNTAAAKLAVDRVYPNNIFALFAFQGQEVFQENFWDESIAQALGNRVEEKELNLKAKPNEIRETEISLEALTKRHGPGLYRLGLSAVSGPGSQRWALVTDLGLVAKRGERDLAIWALSLTDATPRQGADVTVLSPQNQVLAKGKTDAQGIFRTTLPKNEDGTPQEPFLVLATLAGEVGFLAPREFRTDTTGLDVDGVELSAKGYQAFLWSERNLYRPGESVRGALLVRDQTIAPVPALPMKLTLKDPQGRDVTSKALKTDAQGLAEYGFDLPSIAMTGGYTAQLTAADEPIGDHRIQVEEFVPDRVAVDIRPQATPPAGSGGPVAFTVAGNYLFGPPAADQAVEVRVRLKAAPFVPPGMGDYLFGDSSVPFEELEIFKDEAVFDKDGQKPYSVPLPAGLTPPGALEAVVTARVQEAGGRGVLARRSFPAHVHAAYPGVRKLEKQGYAPGEEVSFAGVVVTPDGKSAAPSLVKGLTAELYQERWQTVLRRSGDGGYRYQSTRDPVLVERRVLPSASEVTFGFTPPTHGSYHVILRNGPTGATARQDFFVSGAGYAPWSVDNPARLTVALDKTEYAAGETAVVQIRSPFPGQLLVTVENNQLRHIQSLTMAGNTAEVRIPVEAAWAPNAYISAMVLRGAKELLPGTPARAIGAAPLFVDRAKGRLPLTIDAPKEMRPKNRVDIRVQAEPGAKVTIAAVDEGILRLIAQKTPDPQGFFYAQRRLGVETFDAFALLYPEARKSPAGGDGFLAALRQMLRTDSMRRPKPVAFWSGVVTADATGVAQASFEVPEFQGALRIMAVGTQGRRFGSAERTVICKSPLVLLPTVPRFLAPQDAVSVSTTVRNDTGKAGKFVVQLAAQGPVATQPGASEATLSLEPGQEKLTSFLLTTAQEAGEAALTFTAQGNGEKSEVVVNIPVRWSLPSRGETIAGVAQGSDTRLNFASHQQLIPQTARIDLRVGGRPLLRYAGNLKELLAYPYGCLEQTVSRAMPLIQMGDLAEAMAGESMSGMTAQALVQQGIIRVRAMQAVDGGFTQWPGGTDAHPWSSVYATHFLVEAAKAGNFVDDGLRANGLDYTRNLAAQASLDDHDDRTLAAYGLYVLALAGQADSGLMDNLKARTDLSADQAALLGAAFALNGDRASAQQLVSKPLKDLASKRQTSGIFDSPIRGRALRLAAMADVDPAGDITAEAAADLEKLLAGNPHLTTQESAFSLLAMGKLARSSKSLKPASGKVMAGETSLGAFSTEKPLRIVAHPADTKAEALRIVVDQGQAFYTATVRGVPTVQAFTPSSAGLTVKREFLTRDGQPVTGALKQGQLVVARITVESTIGPIGNVAVSHLLPAGLEAENPRLSGSELLPWMEQPDTTAYLDVRDDRVLAFVDLTGQRPLVLYALLRAVAPGTFALPPVQAQAMYDPAIMAVGPASSITVERSGP